MENKDQVASTLELMEAPNEKIVQRVFNLIILDESGSMAAIAMPAVVGLNETFQTIRTAQKEHQDQQHYISFVTFNSARIRTLMNCQPVDCEKKMRWTDFKPDVCTPLYDAMGQSLNDLKNHVTEEDVVLVTIITDGMENASKEYNGRDIKKLVAELKEKGWVFAYIGTNQDVDAVADGMGIESRMCYDYSETGTSDMFEMERSRRQEFYGRLQREGRRFMQSDNYDYFCSNEDKEESPKETKVEVSEKEPDIIWDLTDNCNKQDSKDLSNEVNEPKSSTGLWGTIRRIIKG